MNKEFIPYEEALALKELGFDEPCFAIYNLGLSEFETANIGQIRLFSSIFRIDDKQSNISYINDKNTSKVTAPLYQQAFRWFRKEHGLYSSIIPKKSWPDDYVTGVEWYVNICGGNGKEIGPEGIFSYEEAELACLKKLIEIVKNKQYE